MENDIFKKNKNLRDYDKEPIILKNYEMPFCILSDIIPYLFAGIIVVLIEAFLKNEINEVLFTMGFIFMVAFIFIGLEFIEYKKNKPEILLKNTSIEYYEKRKLVHKAETQNLSEIICKLLFCYSSRNKSYQNLIIVGIFMFAILIVVFGDLFMLFLYLMFIFFLIVGNMVIKFIFCILTTKKGDRHFSLFPIIIIGKSPKKSIQQIPLYRSIIVNSEKYTI